MTSQEHSSKKPDSINKTLIKRMLIPAIITVYLTFALIIAGLMLFDVSTEKFWILNQLGFALRPDAEYISIVKLIFYTAIGGAIGAITFGMMNLQKRVTSNTFNPVYLGDYMLRPIGSAALAVVLYALLRGGVLTILGGDPTASSIAAPFSAFGIGFLTGFGNRQIVEKLNDLVNKTFGKIETKELKDDKDKENNLESSKVDEKVD